MLLYPIFFKKEIRHTHFFPLFPLSPLNRYISLRFIFFSRHHDMQRLFLIFDDDFCVPASEFAVQRPRDLFLCLHLQPGGFKAIHLCFTSVTSNIPSLKSTYFPVIPLNPPTETEFVIIPYRKSSSMTVSCVVIFMW